MKRLALLLLLPLGGCSSGISANDASAVREEFSQERYEAAMKKAGREDELAREKAAAAERAEN